MKFVELFCVDLQCWSAIRTCILLFASSGKLENQKTVLTNIGSNRTNGSSAMYDPLDATQRCQCWLSTQGGRSTGWAPKIRNWQFVCSFLQQMAVLWTVLTVVGMLHLFFLNASVCCLPIGCFLEKFESRWQLRSLEFFFGTVRFEIFRRCLIPAYVRILITPILFCWLMYF